MDEEDITPTFLGDPPAAAGEEVLPDRRELALVAVERTRMPMIVTDPRQVDNPIVLANQAFFDLTGYSAPEVIGRNCRFLQGPETDLESIEAIRRGLAERADHVDVELLNYRKDGTPFWNQLMISPVTDSSGKLIYYFASQKDVTESRRAEELARTERLLIEEVDHRALNALALVQSIVELSRSDSATRFAASVRGRIAALVRAHRILADAGWDSVDVGELTRAEVARIGRDRVRWNGAPVRLPPDLVQPVAIVLHELASNALHHGALSRADGAVDLIWDRLPERTILRWREIGTAHPEPPQHGAGLRMVHGIVERQLGGRLSTKWDEPGFQADLEFPTGGV